MKIIKYILNSILTATNIVVALLFIVSAHSGRIPPSASIIVTYLGLAFPLLLGATAIFLLYFVLTRNWKRMLISIAAMAICTNSIKQYCPLNISNKPKEGTIKVLTYNVMNFGYLGNTKESPNPILDYIENSGADIVCMQEFRPSNAKGAVSLSMVNKALSMYPYRKATSFNSKDSKNYGIALYSKFPITETESIAYESKHNGSLQYTLNINGKKVLLINNHLESFKLTSKDKTAYSEFIVGEKRNSQIADELFGLFTKKLSSAFLLRERQAEKLAKVIENAKEEYIIVVGDLNDHPLSYTHSTISNKLLDAFTESGNGLGISYNRQFFWFRLDNILHSNNIESYECTIDRFHASDHNPMWTYLKLKD